MAVAMAHLALPNDDMEISSDVEGGNFIDIEVDDDIGDAEDYMVDDNAVTAEGTASDFLTHKLKDDDIMVDDGEAQNDGLNGPTIDNDVVLLDDEGQEDGDIPVDDLDPSHVQEVTTPKPDYAAQHALLRSLPDTNHDNDLSTLPSAASSPGVPAKDYTEFVEHPPQAVHFSQSDDENGFEEAASDTQNIVPGANGSTVHEHSRDDVTAQSEHNLGLELPADSHQLDNNSDTDPLVDRVHPVLVQYGEEEVVLFRTHDTEDTRPFFFDDESLVFESVKDVLRKCRELLAASLDEHTILELRIPVLELIIAEVGSSYIFLIDSVLTCLGFSRSWCADLT